MVVEDSCKAMGEPLIQNKKRDESSQRTGRFDGDVKEARFV